MIRNEPREGGKWEEWRRWWVEGKGEWEGGKEGGREGVGEVGEEGREVVELDSPRNHRDLATSTDTTRTLSTNSKYYLISKK